MSSDSDSDGRLEITEESIASIIKYCVNGSRNSVKRLLKLYHDVVKCRSSKKDEVRGRISIDESTYIDLIINSHEYALKLFNQTGPVTEEGVDLKVRIAAKTFVLDTLLLISSNKSPIESIILSLNTLSKPSILRWIIAINRVELQFLKITFRILSNYPNHKARLSAFSVLKLYIDTILLSNFNNSQYGNLLRNGLRKCNAADLLNKRLTTFALGLYKSYLHSLSKGLNPRNWTLSRLSRNSVVELLLMIKSDKLYVIGFKQLRKIARDTIDAWKKSKLDGICTWSYVESITIWATIIGRMKPHLDHLVYPLVTVATASLKLGQTNERFAPFVLYISKELNLLSRSINRFIPIASHLLALLDIITKSTQNPSKGRKVTSTLDNGAIDSSDDISRESISRESTTRESISRESTTRESNTRESTTREKSDRPKAELAIFKLSLSQKKKTESGFMEHVEDLSRIVITQHVSLLAHHPSFPEVVLPIAKHLKKYKTIKPWVKTLLTLINESSDMIKKLRNDIKLDNPNLDQLIFFKNAKIPIILHNIREMELMEQGISNILNNK